MSSESTAEATGQIKEQASLDSYYGDLAKELALQPSRPHSVPYRQDELGAIIDKVVADSTRLHILELACGVGFWTKRLALRAQSVHAIDISPAAIQVARDCLKFSHVNFEIRDAFAIDYIDPRVDLVFAGFLLSHIRREELWSFFFRLHSGARKGTRFMFIDNTRADRTLRPLASIDGNGNTFDRRALRSGVEYIVLKNYFADIELSLSIGDRVDDLQIDRREYYYTVSYTIG